MNQRHHQRHSVLYSLSLMAIGILVYWMTTSHPSVTLDRLKKFKQEIAISNAGGEAVKADETVTLAEVGQFGDIFGSLNAQFAAYAFIILFIGLIFQQFEYSSNLRFMKQQTRHAQLAGLLTALPVLICQQRTWLHALAPQVFKLEQVDGFGVEKINDLLTKPIEKTGMMGVHSANRSDVRKTLTRLKQLLEQMEEAYVELQADDTTSGSSAGPTTGSTNGSSAGPTAGISIFKKTKDALHHLTKWFGR